MPNGLLFLMLMLSANSNAQSDFPAPHDPAFANFFVEPHTISGTILNIPGDYDGFPEVTVYTPKLNGSSYVLNQVVLNDGGKFSFQLPVPFPVVEILLSFGNNVYTSVWMDGDVHLEIDVEKVENRKEHLLSKKGYIYTGEGEALAKFYSEFRTKLVVVNRSLA